MPNLTKITFDHPLNPSLQVGDAVYVSDILAGGITSEPVFTALALEVGLNYVTIDKDIAVNPIITSGQFILFSKHIQVNESSLKGYYANVTFKNSSNKNTELFAISSEVVLSSK